MTRPILALSVALMLVSCGGPKEAARKVTTESELRDAIASGAPDIEISGVIALAHSIELAQSVKPLVLRGSGTLRVQPDFQGRAAIYASRRSNVTFIDFTIDGARPENPSPVGLPPYDQTFAGFYRRNGIVVEGGSNITLLNLHLTRITDFPVIASGVRNLHITGVNVQDSGSLNERGRNNTTGGILLEEGTSDFEVRNCTLERVLGNAIWTHSISEPRSTRGVIAGNFIRQVARDAIQVGHATEIRVESNTGDHIGYPPSAVDAESDATPVALDTSGNVDRTVYRDNRFRNVNGQCINLDGFHHGEVRRNVCESTASLESYPNGHTGIVMDNANRSMVSESVIIADNQISGSGYGGLYLIGHNHTVTGNRFTHLNRNHCTGDATPARCNYALDQPDMLRSGIYLAAGANRPERTAGNTIRDNQISGFGMSRWCITAAKGLSLSDNTVKDNVCAEESSKR